MEHLDTFIVWYEELHRRIEIHGYSDYMQGQLTMISNVLKQLMSDKDYSKLTTVKYGIKPPNSQLF